MTETTNTTNGNGNTTITRPCGVWTMVNAMVSNGWGYARELSKDRKPTRRPRKFTCPACKERLSNEGKKGNLLDRATKNVVVFSKEGRPSVALCHVCNYKKKEGSKEAPPPEGGKAPAPPTAAVCTRKDCNNPLPSDRKALCYSCCPPGKKASAVKADPPVAPDQY